MKTNEIVLKRFQELEAASTKVRFNQIKQYTFIEDQSWQKWATNVLNLLQQVFGVQSVHYQNFRCIYNKPSHGKSEFNAAFGVFLAAKEDYEGGYLFSLESTISGEIFGDFIALARHSINEGYKDVAAVLACAALEDALKNIAVKYGLEVGNKPMKEVVSALKSIGLVGGAQKSLLNTMPKIRDYAMHANWEKIKPEDVSSVIGFIEQLLLQHFS